MNLAASQGERASVTFEMLTEPVVVPDVFITGMVEPECVNEEGTLRLTFFTKQRSSYGGGDDFVVVSKLVISPQAAWSVAKTILAYFGYSTLTLVRDRIARLAS
jgi:hypothetical protein